jgi:hypothetical protein
MDALLLYLALHVHLAASPTQKLRDGAGHSILSKLCGRFPRAEAGRISFT